MTQKSTHFMIEGELGKLWREAEETFLKSEIAISYRQKPRVESAKSPAEWLEGFREYRKGDSRFIGACKEIGKHMEIIETFVQALGFSVQVVSAVAPAFTPASLVVNAFAWLFGSFTKVSEDFDKLETFFGRIANRLESLIPLGKYLKGGTETALLQKRIVKLFVSCLGICNVGTEQVKSRLKTWVKKLKGENEVDKDLDKFAEANEALRDCIDVNTLGAVLSQQEASQRDEILGWLSSIDSSGMHQRVIEQTPDRVIGGKWLLLSELFMNWKNQWVDRIWYTGKPGAGKSVLASTVIEHLRSWVKEDEKRKTNTMVTHLYLSYTSSPDVKDLLGSLLRQYQGEADTHPYIVAKFEEYRRQGKIDNKVQPPSLDDIKGMLNSINEGKTMFVIVDALDEFDINSRNELLKSLKQLKPVVKIMVTSRVLNHLAKLQETFEPATIEAKDEDMDEYIESVIKNNPSLAPYPKSHAKIKNVVKRRSGRMFILVRLHMDALSNVQNRFQLDNVLKKLPNDLQNAYKDTMIRLKSQTEDRTLRATSTLGWVAFSEKLLSVQELQHALAITESKGRPPLQYLRQEKEIISECCGLLVIDLDERVRYVHRSAQEFFNETKHKEFPNFEAQITLACIRYLSLSELTRRVVGKSRRPRSNGGHEAFPLKDYAAQYLHRHHRRMVGVEDNTEVAEAAYNLVTDKEKRTFYSGLLFRLNVYETKSAFMKSGRSTTRQKWRANTMKPLQPLHLAVYMGNSRLVTRLINEGADINSLDPYGRSALVVALHSGLDFIAGILLRNGAEIDLNTKRGHAILLHCMERDYKSVIEQILGDTTEVLPNEGFLKILGFLCLFFFEQMRGILTILVTSFPQSNVMKTEVLKAPPSEATSMDKEPKLQLDIHMDLLRYAYSGNVLGLESILRASTTDVNLKLVSQGAEYVYTDTGEDDSDDNRPRYYSSPEPDSESDSETDYGHDSKLESSSIEPTSEAELNDNELLSDSPPSSLDEVWPSFSASSTRALRRRGRRNVHLARTTARAWEGRSHSTTSGSSNDRDDVDTAGSSKGDQADGSHVSDVDRIKVAFLRTACFLAAESGKHEAVQLLLDHGVSPDLSNFHGQSLLHRATWREDCKLVDILIRNDANVDLRDRNGRTPLLANADLRKNRVLKLLLDKKADIDLKQREGCHELYEAAAFGAEEAVEFFLEHDIDPSIANNFGWTPLHGAAANGHLEIVERLIEKGVNLSPLSDTYETPLSLAQHGERHYDHILTGGKHYAEAIRRARELSVEEKITRKDDILDLLLKRGALTYDGLIEQRGEDVVGEMRRSIPSWQNNSWWDEPGRKQPYYYHTE